VPIGTDLRREFPLQLRGFLLRQYELTKFHPRVVGAARRLGLPVADGDEAGVGGDGALRRHIDRIRI
jgi:hypothetical protein